MSNYKFNVDTTGLTAYVDENKTELLYQLQMDSDLTQYASIEAGVKGTRRLHLLDETVTFQTDSCAFNASGTSTFTEKDITVADIKIQDEICVQSLDRFWTEQVIRKGAEGYEVIPDEINQAFMAKRMNKIKNLLNTADWQGDIASGSANLNKYDGLLKTIFADASTVDGNTSDAATATTVSNIDDRMQEMYLAIPDDLFGGAPDGGDLVWFLPTDYYRLYIEYLKTANLFHWVGGENGSGSLTYFGTNITLVPQIGLASQNKMVITTKDNLIVALDGEGDADNMKIWYSQDDQIHKRSMRFKRGVNYKFSSYIVRWGLGAS